MNEELRTAYHEASHAIAAQSLGLDTIYLSIRPAEGEAGRTRFDTASEGFWKLDEFSCAIIRIAGEVGERMAAGETKPQFNWFADSDDAETARTFIASLDGDELDARHWATFRAYALLRTRWEAVEELAAKLEEDTTVLGEHVARICLAAAARRSARSIAASPPPPKPASRPRRPKRSGEMERRPFKITAEKKEG